MAELISSNYSKESFPELLTLGFGMSKAEVKDRYQRKGLKPIFERSNSLDFMGPPVDIPDAAETKLLFKKNLLVEVAQYFHVPGDDSSAFKHIAKYRDLKDQLTAKYGPTDSIEFMEDAYNNSELRLKGFKIKKGNYASIWRNVGGNMDVFLVLGGDQLDTLLRVTYKLKETA